MLYLGLFCFLASAARGAAMVSVPVRKGSFVRPRNWLDGGLTRGVDLLGC